MDVLPAKRGELHPSHSRTTADAARSKSSWPWILGAACVALYLWSFPADCDGIIIGNDVVAYADDLIGGSEHPLLGSPNHLGYHWLCYLVYRVLALWPGSVMGNGLALVAQQVVAAIGGGLTIVAIARLSARQGGWKIALPLSCALALTEGLWLSSAVGDSYLPAMSAAAWLLCSALGPVVGAQAPHSLTLFSLLLAATLIRQDAVWIVAPLFLLVPWRRLVPLVVGAGLCSLGLYGLAWIHSGVETSFSTWLLGEGARGLWGKGWSVEGFGIAGRYLMSIFQAAHFAHPQAGWATLCVLLTAVSLSWPFPRSAIRGVCACALYGAVCFGFYAWWEADNFEYQIPMLLPFSAAAALLLRPRGSRARNFAQLGLLWTVATALFFGTWLTDIRPNRGSGMSVHSRLALEAAGPDGVVFELDAWEGLALTRERRFLLGDKLNSTTLIPMSGAAAPNRAEATGRLRHRVREFARSGRRVVLIGDQVLVPDQIGPDRADPQIVDRLLTGIPHTPILNEHGEVVAQLIEPLAR